MGIARWVSEIIIREHAYRPIQGTVMVIGRQTMNISPLEAINLMLEWNVTPITDRPDEVGTDDETQKGKGTGFIRDDEFFRLLGVDNFVCLDHSDYEGAKLIHDLNQPLPPNLECSADFILDGSTLDNIFNPALGLINLNRLLKPGGRLITLNVGTNCNVPYLIFTPMWFFDYFCINRFNDVKLYHVSMFEDGFNIVTPSLNYLNRSIDGVHNPLGHSEAHAAVFCLAEKGTRSSWDMTPSQHHYRLTEEWDRFDANLNHIKRSTRPHLTWSTTEWRCHVPKGYDPLLSDQEAIYRTTIENSATRTPEIRAVDDASEPKDQRKRLGDNDLGRYVAMMRELRPFSGQVPKGFTADFLGRLTDARFYVLGGFNPDDVGGVHVEMPPPDLTGGEGFFEVVNWVEAAREARGSYTMITLGACWGAQAVGALLALKKFNPMPARLVAIEADPGNFAWLKKHFRDNGFDPDQHWLMNCAVSDSNKPVLFPVGSTGIGANNCISTNELFSRQVFVKELIEKDDLATTVYNLFVHGKTGIELCQPPGSEFRTEVEFVSAVTLADILGPLDRIDLLEADMQCSEGVVFSPCMEAISEKVRRVHIGTHSVEIHAMLRAMFADCGFKVIFDYEPRTRHETPWGSFEVNDGIITALNSELAPQR